MKDRQSSERERRYEFHMSAGLDALSIELLSEWVCLVFRPNIWSIWDSQEMKWSYQVSENQTVILDFFLKKMHHSVYQNSTGNVKRLKLNIFTCQGWMLGDLLSLYFTWFLWYTLILNKWLEYLYWSVFRVEIVNIATAHTGTQT